MAKKELTEDDILKKQYSALVKLNDRLKNICSIYYIGYDGMIYMKSLVTFIEKFARLKSPEDIDRFMGCMILPNALFEFKKNAKKKVLTITKEDAKYIFGQEDNEELSHTINIVNQDSFTDTSFIDVSVKPDMYKKFFSMNDDSYMHYPETTFEMLSEEDTLSIVGSNPMFIHYNDTELTITRHLLMDAKKTDLIGFKRMNYQIIENSSKRVCYMLKLETDLYDGYTIFNVLQS